MTPIDGDCFRVIQLTSSGGRIMDTLCYDLQLGLRSIYLHVAFLEECEVDLRQGRFERFSKHSQSCKVHLHDTQLSYSDRLVYNGKLIDWIAQHVRSNWSFEVAYTSMDANSIVWSFLDPAEAVLFKLTWS